MDKLYIVVPAYNESENLDNLIRDWYPVIEKHNGDNDSRLVIINDGSKDNTYELLQEYAKTRPRIQPMTKQNGGHGSTVLFGYRYAIAEGADYISTLTRTAKRIQMNLSSFGKTAKNMMPLLAIALYAGTASPENLWRTRCVYCCE